MVNQWIGIGNVGKDPETRFLTSGQATCAFSIACNEKWKDKEGNAQERVTWVNCVAWGKLAEICGQYLSKGKQVFVSGRLQNRSYEDKDGNKKYITEIVCDQVRFLGGGAGKSDGRQATPYTPQQALPMAEEDLPF